MSGTEWTIEQWVAHGREWIAVGWEWAGGQVALSLELGRWRPVVITSSGDGGPKFMTASISTDVIPYLANDGTRGHALGQVRRAWGDPGIYCRRFASCWPRLERWYVARHNGQGPKLGYGSTEHEALLAARRSAP